MVFVSKIEIFFITLLAIAIDDHRIDGLLWPQHSVLQITASGSIPLILTHKRKSYFDYGFQMNYNLPYRLDEFYNVPIWPTKIRRRKRTDTSNKSDSINGYAFSRDYDARDSIHNRIDDIETSSTSLSFDHKSSNGTTNVKMLLTDNGNNSDNKHKYNENCLRRTTSSMATEHTAAGATNPCSTTTQNDDIHPSDFTAGELYEVVEQLLKEYGYDETCLLKAICEHARHPFDDIFDAMRRSTTTIIGDGDRDMVDVIERENFIEEIISLILSPSLHDGFAADEADFKHIYENAEMHGRNGGNCDALYPDCKRSILDLISTVKIFE